MCEEGRGGDREDEDGGSGGEDVVVMKQGIDGPSNDLDGKPHGMKWWRIEGSLGGI